MEKTPNANQAEAIASMSLLDLMEYILEDATVLTDGYYRVLGEAVTKRAEKLLANRKEGIRPPLSRGRVLKALAEGLAITELADPVVGIVPIDSGSFRLRVTQNAGLPKYFRVKVTEEKP